ncbi:MAG: hypothetical protein QS721_11680 [Candidatus Endonucleobacter sp. (ex Gigantidas childressi)]|nr:hypothetical protein [Candidatus Endonucleobacter sp. (ex Gigantidas childressi)]
MLAALAHPDHLLVGSRVFAYLPPSSNLKSFGYIPFTHHGIYFLVTKCFTSFYFSWLICYIALIGNPASTIISLVAFTSSLLSTTQVLP